MNEIEEFMSSVRQSIDAELDRLLPAAEAEPVKLHEAIRWSVFAGGKRIRPALVFAAGSAFSADEKDLVRTAAAIEMIHTYSLIHDDLPAMDDDDLRRGRATCHIKFGEATAILAGDVLQTLAFKAISEDVLLAAETRMRLISIIADASGTPGGMVAGQQRDLDAEGISADLSILEAIHKQKTGAMIRVSVESGAVIGGASEQQSEVVREFAEKLGLLFQITDDLLDVTQTTEMLGKTAGKDEAASKTTYPALFGVERSRELTESVFEDSIKCLGRLDLDTEILAMIARSVVDRKN